jgi:hypothetical protein
MDVGRVSENFSAPDKWAQPIPPEMYANVKAYQEPREALELVAQVLPQTNPGVGRLIDLYA